MKDYVLHVESIPHAVKLSKPGIAYGQLQSPTRLLMENTSPEIKQKGSDHGSWTTVDKVERLPPFRAL